MSAARPFILCSAGVVGITLLGVYLNAAESPTPAVRAPDLSQRVTTLEERVVRLEKLLADRAPGSPLVAPPTPTPAPGPPVPTQPQLTPGLPRNAVPFEFNGGTYYIVPLAKEAAR